MLSLIIKHPSIHHHHHHQFPLFLSHPSCGPSPFLFLLRFIAPVTGSLALYHCLSLLLVNFQFQSHLILLPRRPPSNATLKVCSTPLNATTQTQLDGTESRTDLSNYCTKAFIKLAQRQRSKEGRIRHHLNVKAQFCFSFFPVCSSPLIFWVWYLFTPGFRFDFYAILHYFILLQLVRPALVLRSALCRPCHSSITVTVSHSAHDPVHHQRICFCFSRDVFFFFACSLRALASASWTGSKHQPKKELRLLSLYFFFFFLPLLSLLRFCIICLIHQGDWVVHSVKTKVFYLSTFQAQAQQPRGSKQASAVTSPLSHR